MKLSGVAITDTETDHVGLLAGIPVEAVFAVSLPEQLCVRFGARWDLIALHLVQHSCLATAKDLTDCPLRE